MRSILALALTVAAGVLVACGGDSDTKGPLGTQSNPLVAVPNPSPTRTPPTKPRNEAGARSAKASTGRPPGSSTAGSTSATKGTSGASSKRAGSGETPRRSRRKQKTLPASPQRPCSLVTKHQARSIIGAAINEPLQAPQGPTCIYQTPSGKQHVTLAVQTVDFATLRRQLRKTRRVDISGRTAYCGTYGRPMLYLPLAGRQVLSISAPCATATAFAIQAAARL
ncbi:MAG: hypothetical protein ACR2H2_14015 [Solirubrobacteraceae bacterium]